MRWIHLDDQRTVNWSGGTTTELAIAPEGTAYAERNFDWRLSTAVVEDEESVFTALPDYNRLLALRKGTLLLRHDEDTWYELKPGRAVAFDGGSRTESRGRVTDFNLMLRKGCVEGSLRCLSLAEVRKEMPACELFGTEETMSTGTCLALFLSEGGPLTLFPDGKEVLQAGEMLRLESDEEAAECRIPAGAEGELIAARIRVMPEHR
ncbi:MAG: HutD family protein [Lachnospiraceae bacterium]|nr:HutD family protein [Lachnospiraceae bacterium]